MLNCARHNEGKRTQGDVKFNNFLGHNTERAATERKEETTMLIPEIVDLAVRIIIDPPSIIRAKLTEDPHIMDALLIAKAYGQYPGTEWLNYLEASSRQGDEELGLVTAALRVVGRLSSVDMAIPWYTAIMYAKKRGLPVDPEWIVRLRQDLKDWPHGLEVEQIRQCLPEYNEE